LAEVGKLVAAPLMVLYNDDRTATGENFFSNQSARSHGMTIGLSVCSMRLHCREVSMMADKIFPGDTRRKKLDHFKVYNVIDRRVRRTVKIRGQFDPRMKQVKLTALTHFANPVSKNDSGIKNAAAHLTWYTLKQETREPLRTVTLANQFGEQKWVIDQPKFLLVPAEKNKEGSPKKLDHYKAYEVVDVIGAQVRSNVTLVDQWFQQRSPLRGALFFCVPVLKQRGTERPRPLHNKVGHLAVYRIRRKTVAKPPDLKVRDQFLRDKLIVKASLWLCVPSRKLKVT
jgi:hypothetical protein